MVIDLIVFDMSDFEMILGIDFMSWYGFEIDYKKKKVWFHLDDGKEFIFNEGHVLSMMINNIKARKMLSKGCMGYLTHGMRKTDDIVLSLQSIAVMCEF